MVFIVNERQSMQQNSHKGFGIMLCSISFVLTVVLSALRFEGFLLSFPVHSQGAT